MAKPLALTTGEPAGIGPDIAIKAWLRRNELKLPAFYLLGDRDFVAKRAKILGLNIELACVSAEQAVAAFASALPIVATGRVATAQPGQPDETSAEAALASVRRAVADVVAGQASAIVTNPIAKSVLYRAGFNHPGHTEFLAELAGQNGRAPQPVMMLWSPALAVVPVTIHLALREALTQLTTDLIVTTARIAVADLNARFGLARPRLAVSGLNPHAGEEGSLGMEDIEIVAPAVEILRQNGCFLTPAIERGVAQQGRALGCRERVRAIGQLDRTPRRAAAQFRDDPEAPVANNRVQCGIGYVPAPVPAEGQLVNGAGDEPVRNIIVRDRFVQVPERRQGVACARDSE